MSHRQVRDTWSRRLTVTAFVAAGSVLRWTGAEHRAMVEPDPYGDAYAPTAPRPRAARVLAHPGAGRVHGEPEYSSASAIGSSGRTRPERLPG